MTDIEKKRLSLAGRLRMASVVRGPDTSLMSEAADTIEQHEAFRREVSDAVKACGISVCHPLHKFVIAKPVDPLVEAIRYVFYALPNGDIDEARMAEELRATHQVMKDQIESWEFEEPRGDWWKWQHQYAEAADRIEALEAALVIDRAMVAGEPVALAQYHPASGERELEWYRHGAGRLTNADKEGGWEETALYAHPAPDTAALVSALEGLVRCFNADGLHHLAPVAGGNPKQAKAVAKARHLIAQHKGTEHG